MDATEAVRHNIRLLRTAQRITYMELTGRLSALGQPIPLLGLRRIERGERRVDVGELAAFAEIFGVNAAALLQPFECDHCHGNPPTGYGCNTCGAGRTPESAPQYDFDNSPQLSALQPPSGNLSNEFLRHVAAVYVELVDAGRHPAPAIAEQTKTPVATARRWIATARKRGHLPPATQGRVG